MRHATLYPPSTGAVPTTTPKVGTPGPKVGTPMTAAWGAGAGGKRQPQPGETVLPGKNAYMTVFVDRTVLTVPSVPTFGSENRFLMGALTSHGWRFMDTPTDTRTRARRALYIGLIVRHRPVGTVGTPGTARRQAAQQDGAGR